ncbi:MAG: L-2-amino-thiazoline-4-carboxylic acid hydrolase [Candidatus Bathyarchaeota archaeon]|nr:L-2-amino-thiazoline-4-carboxylic acid hydrolase [Candidatus Bathyarchaeota archaeon]
MGLRLRFLEWWTPGFLIKRELQSINKQITEALKALIPADVFQKVDFPQMPQESIHEQRAAMAQTHTKLVKMLEQALGHEQAIQQGREALFLVGQRIGRKTRAQLGVGDNPADLERAAKILYRVLGISFHLQWLNSSSAVAIIDRCALSKEYSEFTCEILCATDEGVISGLQPNVTMKFVKYMTGGCQNCRATLQFTPKEATV